MSDNPYLEPIYLALLSQAHWKLNNLSCYIKKQLPDKHLDSDPNQRLYKHNFLIMNALFTLQKELQAQSYTITIDSINIRYQKLSNEQSLTNSDSSLRDYYLNWHNFSIDEQEIAQLLASFWLNYHDQKHVSDAEIQNALTRFNLTHDTTFKEIKSQWRKRANILHPDKRNGDKDLFQQLQSDWKILCVKYKPKSNK